MRTANAFRIVVPALVLLGSSACFQPESITCDNGNFCPPNMRCVSKDGFELTGKICVSEACGDGQRDSNEQCDDGQQTATCTSLCTESKCGDGHINPAAGEQCDPGAAGETAECTATCKLSKCGDGYVNKVVVDGAPLEQCDDGKESADCNADCTLARCGDTKINQTALEECDPGAAGKNADCTDKCKNSKCGDGYVNTGFEECDPGAENTDTPTCTAKCTNSTCGDQYINKAALEDCDDGTETAKCTATCKASICGDRYVNKVALEDCDDGEETAACTALCKFSKCGDKYINRVQVGGAPLEQCDDGGESKECNADCTTARCGDGKINKSMEPPEVCDDGPAGSASCTTKCTASACGDAIVNTLTVPAEQCDPGVVGGETPTCNSDCTTAVCGDGKINKSTLPNPEICDDGPAGSATCTSKCTASSCGDAIINTLAVPPEQCDPGQPGAKALCNADCTNARCGDGKLNLDFIVVTPTGSHPEECDPGSETANCNQDCSFSHCGDGKVNTAAGEECDPGAAGETAGCNDDCTTARCGDSKINKTRGEECDEGEETAICNGPAAGAVACHFSKCHDGYTNGLALENCDPGAETETAACNSDCTTSRCHDGKTNAAAGEDCDPGGTLTTETADCNNDCTTSVCGDFKLNKADGEQCDAPVNCNDCRSAECGDDIVNPAIGEECDPGAAGETPSCTSNCKISSCGDAYANHALVRVGTDCTVLPCPTGQSCVGGVCWRPAETCDIGKPGQEDATCNVDCTDALCGDAKLNRANGEQCDDRLCEDFSKQCQTDSDCTGIGTGKCVSGSATCNGTAANAKACKTSYCGDGYTNPVPAAKEDCDPGPSFETDACNSDCSLATCGDGKVNRKHALAGGGFEECDPGGTASIDPTKTFQTPECNFDCTATRCGDLKINLDAGEECDDGPLGSAACTTDCKFSTCGDGKVNPKANEECDEATAVASATCNNNAAGAIATGVQCKLTRCGDGFENPAKEGCDPGAGLLESATCNSDCTDASCGDGKLNVTANEQCDDGAAGSSKCNGNDALAVAAGAQCKFARCGDSYTNSKTSPLEQCDTGGESASCNRDCTTASCGDGKINLARNEQCDDGLTGSATCNRKGAVAVGSGASVECKLSKCGDDFANTPTESCDPGSAGETASCNRDCTAASCGDLKTNTARGEQCDDGVGGSATCTPQGAKTTANALVECKLSRCGDDYQAAAEGCDPGAAGETSACNRDCTVASCGDLKINTARGEQCDDGVGGSASCTPQGAKTTANVPIECKVSRCGDDYKAATEGCDPGAAGETTACNRDCTVASCGDSKINAARAEQCDDGVAGSATCTPQGAKTTANVLIECKVSKCGDDYKAAGESCDPGSAGETTTCNRDCTAASCGDNKINVARGEQCDVGAAGSAACNKAGAVNGTGGSVECKFSNCGDHYTNTLAGETCDLGAANNGNSKDCLANCLLATCGDGYIESAGTAPHEVCDQGADNDRTTCPYGSVSCTSCRNGCTQLITINGAFCGDGIEQVGEQCDSGNSLGCGLCKADCSQDLVEAPAKGTVDFPDRGSLDDNMLLTLDDGLNPPVVFQFVQNSATVVASPRVKVDISGSAGDKDYEIAGKLVSAMASVFDRLRLKATTGSNGVVNLENAHVGKFGNRPMSVTDSSVYLYNNLDYDDALKQGVGYGCSEGVGCFDSRDCFPGTACVSRVCTVTSYRLNVVTGTYLGRIQADVGALDCGEVCEDDYPANTLVVLTASVTAPATWGGWEATGPCGSAGMATKCTVTMDAAKTVTGIFNGVNQYQLTVTRSGLSGSVSTGDGAITDCTGTCTAGGYAANASVTLTATDGATDVFTGWSGACTGTTNPCVLNMGTSDKGVTATFLPASTLTVEAATSNGGTGTITSSETTPKINCGADCTEKYLTGSSVTVTATPGANSIFTGWTSTPAGLCSANPCTFTLNEAATLTATFEKLELTLLKAGDGTGTVAGGVGGAPDEIDCGATCSAVFSLNDAVSLTATAAADSRFDPATGWLGDATCTANPCTVTMSAAKTVTAHFIKTFVVTVNYAGAGSGTVSGLPAACASPGPCTGTFDKASSVTLTAAAGTGSTFVKWTGVTGCDAAAACTIPNLSADTTATAEFSSP